jgi:hypothetical protein
VCDAVGLCGGITRLMNAWLGVGGRASLLFIHPAMTVDRPDELGSCAPVYDSVPILSKHLTFLNT